MVFSLIQELLKKLHLSKSQNLENSTTSQQSSNDKDVEKNGDIDQEAEKKPTMNKFYALLYIVTISFITLVTNVDRIVFQTVLPTVKKELEMQSHWSKLLEIVFICSCILLAPVFGYYSTRDIRRNIFIGAAGLVITGTVTAIFIPKKEFWFFLCLRTLVEAIKNNYIGCAPAMIRDLFDSSQENRILALFFFSNCFTGIIGIICGFFLANNTYTNWRQALMIPLGLHLTSVMVLPILMHLPGHGALRFKLKDPHKKTSFMSNVKALFTCRTFIFCIIGYGAGMFAYRGVTVWGPTLLMTSRNGTQIQVPCVASICTFDDKIVFAVLKSFSDAIGLTVGALISSKVMNANAHRLPLISAVTLLTAGHMIGCGVVWTRMTIIIPYVFFFVGSILLSMIQIFIVEIILKIVLPDAFGFAFATKSAVAWLLGQLGGVYIVDWISIAIENINPDFKLFSEQCGLMMCAVMAIIGAGFFSLGNEYFKKDKEKLEKSPDEPVISSV